MRLCFLPLCLSAALYAAEPTVPPDVTRTVVTVRADASGRLVRRVVVQPRVVAPIVVKDARAEETAQPAAKLADDASVNEIIDHTAKR
jgi:hypothetical protein